MVYHIQSNFWGWHIFLDCSVPQLQCVRGLYPASKAPRHARPGGFNSTLWNHGHPWWFNGQKARWIYCINMNDVFSLRDILTETLVTDGNCSSDSNTFLPSSTSGTICRVFSFQVGYFTVQFVISEATVTPSAWKQHGDGLGKLRFFLWKITLFAYLKLDNVIYLYHCQFVIDKWR